MTRIARWLHRCGCHLNSGGAHGADRAFADGATPDARTLYLPWPGYNGHSGPDCRVLSPVERTACERLAAELHPAWQRCSRAVRALHARNAAIVLGPRLNRPVHGVICWTPGGQTVGGTGMAMRMADRAGVLVLNLAVYSPRDVCDPSPQPVPVPTGRARRRSGRPKVRRGSMTAVIDIRRNGRRPKAK